MSWTNYHSHCHYCDGKYAPEKYIESALQQGLAAYGFSSHAPLPFETTWAMKAENLPAYVAEIRELQEKYREVIQLYCGLEVDYIPGRIGPKSKAILDAELDYTVGSVHFVEAFPDGNGWEIDGSHQVFLDGLHEIFKGDVQKAVSRYFELTRQMVEQECPDVIGHIDKIKIQDEGGKLFSQEATWYRQEMKQTLQLIADAGAIVEVNTRGIYKKKTAETYPARWVLEEMYKLNIPVTINADAHHPEEITLHFSDAAQLLQAIGFRQVHILYNGTWQAVGFNESGVKI
jgi:histidinol-phosphatase (PHP family)